MEVGRPSKVLHVRGLPPAATEADLIFLCQAFGNVKNILLFTAKQQAFVQLESIDAAASLLKAFAATPAVIRGKNVYFQFSTHDEIKSSTGGVTSGGGLVKPSSVLLISVLNARVPVTLENIFQIIKPYGEVYRIVTFIKQGVYTALVQMGTVESAIAAKTHLEGKDMFFGCCHLRLSFSVNSELKVKSNSATSRDYTTPDAFASYGAPMLPSTGQYGGGGYGVSPYGGPISGGVRGGRGGGGSGRLDHKGAPPMGIHPQMGHNHSPLALVGGYGMAAPSVTEKGCVVLVSNLDAEKVTPDMLFTLFGAYGDVIRVKILYNKRDAAMVQFATSQQAYSAHLYLNHAPFLAHDLSVVVSKHSEISLPRTASGAEDPLTKDYTGSRIHRFRNNPKYARHVAAPSQVLHITNIHDETSEADMRQMFADDATSGNAPVVQFFATDRKMAFVKMGSVSEAVMALVRWHNYKLRDRYLRVSFSHKDPATVSNSDENDDTGEGGAAAI